MYNIIIQKVENKKRVLILKDDVLVEKYDINEETLNEGNIYLGKVQNVLNGLEIAFVDIGEEKNAMIHFADILKHNKKEDLKNILRPGNRILVQVKKDASGTKGAKLTCDLSFTGKYIVYIPNERFATVSRKIEDKEEVDRLLKIVRLLIPRGTGAIIRTEAQNKKVEEIKADLNILIEKWKKVKGILEEDMHKKSKTIGIYSKEKLINSPKLIYKNDETIERIIRNLTEEKIEEIITNDKEVYEKLLPYTFKTTLKGELELDTRMEKQLEIANSRKVWLKSGAYIVIDKTEALTAIDINSAKYNGKKDLEKTFLKVNKEATIEIAKQIKLRNISGIIIIDYINMESEESRKEIIDLLSENLKSDRTKTEVFGFTKLNLLEMTRKHISG